MPRVAFAVGSPLAAVRSRLAAVIFPLAEVGSWRAAVGRGLAAVASWLAEIRRASAEVVCARGGVRSAAAAVNRTLAEASSLSFASRRATFAVVASSCRLVDRREEEKPRALAPIVRPIVVTRSALEITQHLVALVRELVSDRLTARVRLLHLERHLPTRQRRYNAVR